MHLIALGKKLLFLAAVLRMLNHFNCFVSVKVVNTPIIVLAENLNERWLERIHVCFIHGVRFQRDPVQSWEKEICISQCIPSAGCIVEVSS